MALAAVGLAVLSGSPVDAKRRSHEDIVEADIPGPTIAGPDLVVPLDASTIDAFLNDNENVMIMFMAPWCGHCKTIAPVYQDLAHQVRAERELAHVKLGKVDIIDNKELGERFKIKGFPTLTWFQGPDLATNYNGLRDSNFFLDFMKGMVKPQVEVVKGYEVLIDMLSQNAAVILGYFPGVKAGGSPSRLAFEKAAFGSEYKFIVVEETNPVLEERYMLKPGEEAALVERENRFWMRFEGDLTDAEKLREFIKSSSLPPFHFWTDDIIDKFYEAGVRKFLLLLVDEQKNPEDYGVIKRMANAGDLDMPVLHVEPFIRYIWRYFRCNRKTSGLRVVSLEAGMNEPQAYMYFGKFEKEEVVDWLGEYNAGKLEPFDLEMITEETYNPEEADANENMFGGVDMGEPLGKVNIGEATLPSETAADFDHDEL